MMTERRIKFWLATEGWKHNSSNNRDEWGAAAGGSILATIAVLLVVGFPTAMLSGDPFSDWHDTENDILVPWWEETMLAITAVGVFIALCMFLRFLYVAFQYSVTSQFFHGIESSAIYTYRKLPADDRKRLKGSLVELLTYPKKDVSDPVFKKHNDAWETLYADVNEHEKLVLLSQSTTAATRVEDLSATYRHQINQLKKEEELT